MTARRKTARRRPLFNLLGVLIVAGLVWLVGERLGTHPLPAGETAPPTNAALALKRAGAAQVSVVGTNGIGVGVMLDASGDVLAGRWALGAATTAMLHLDNGAQVPAHVRAADARSGLVLLEAATPLPAGGALDAIERLHSGQPVYVLGAGGIRQARAGTLLDTQASRPWLPSLSLLATDVRVCPQDAGGVLADEAGRVVGVLAAREQCGEALALPLSVARHLAAELKAYGRAMRGWIGVTGADAPDGVRLLAVVAGSPAAVAGLRVGDRVLNIDGVPVRQAAYLVSRVAEMPPGHDAALTVQRDGHTLGVTVMVAAEPVR